jgi:uncharacterized membrane protein
MSYEFVLWLHVVAATLLVGSSVAARSARSSVLRASDLAALRGALDVVRRATRFNPLLAILLLATGVWLGSAGFWSAAWFWVALAGWFANLTLAVRVVGPGHQRLGALAGAAGDGPVPAAVDALRRARATAFAMDAMLGLDLGLMLLMAVKPPPGTVLLWPALGVALVVALRVVGDPPRPPQKAPIRFVGDPDPRPAGSD